MNETLPFNGRYTIESPKGGHKTFQIKTAQNGGLKDKRILSLFIGTENTDDRQYKGFAFVNPQGIALWKKDANDTNVKYAEMLTSLSILGEESKFYKLGYRLLAEKTCRKCNRVLTHPDSIKSGLGPECGKRTNKSKPQRNSVSRSAMIEEPMNQFATPNGPKR